MTGPSLALRRRLVRDVQRLRAEAVLAGDGFVCDVLASAALRLKHALAYAENRRHYTDTGRVFAGPKMHGLPPLQNAGDNGLQTGADNAR